MRSRRALLLVSLLGGAPLAGQHGSAATCHLLAARVEHGLRVSGDATFEGAGREVDAVLPAGAWRIAFAPGGGGRPAALPVQAPPGGEVIAATGRPPAPDEQPTMHCPGVFTDARIVGSDDDRDVRVRARVRARSPGAPFGLCCRSQEDHGHYRLLWDPARTELRLERQLGAQQFVLARSKAPPVGEGWHALELQAQGFRLLALCDDAVVAMELDGALSHGRCGTFVAAGAVAEFAELQSAPPAVPLRSLAAARGDGRVEVVARAPDEPGSPFMLCLRLDRPGPLVPTTPAGFECFVLQRPATPVFMLGFAFGTVGPRGEIGGGFDWPAAKLLRGQAALVGGLLGSPDAEHALGWLPWAAVR